MSIFDDISSGHKAGEFNSAPFYLGATWKAKLIFDTADIVGVEHEVYVVANECSTVRLFDCVLNNEVSGSKTTIEVTASADDVETMRGQIDAMVKHQITETATGETAIYFHRITRIESGAVS